jgi:hypothetical protein
MRAQNSFLRPAARLLFIGGILFLSLGIFLSAAGRPASAAGVTVSPRRGPANLSQGAALAAQDVAYVRFDLPDQPLCQFEPGLVTATGSYHLPEGQTARLQLHYYIVHPGPEPTEYIDAGLVSGDGTFSITRPWPGIPVPYPDDYLVEIHFGANLLDPVTGNPILESGAGFDYFWYPYVCTPTPPAAPSDTATPTTTVTPTVTDTPTSTPTFTATTGRTRPPSNPSRTPTQTATVTETDQPGQDDTLTPTPTSTQTATVTETSPPGQDDTLTPTPTVTASLTFTPTVTLESPVQDDTLTPTPTVTASLTFTPTATLESPGQDDTLTPTPTVTASLTFTPTATLESPVQDDTLTPTVTVTASLTNTATATLTLPPLVTITHTLTPTVTSTVTPTSTASVTPSITPTGRPNLVLEGICAYRVENQQYWRLTNNSPFDVQFLWQATATGETGSASVGANSTAFIVTSGPPQNLRIYVGGIVQLEVASSAACLDYLELSVTCTADNQLAWIVFNNNPYPVNVFWTLDNTQNGSGALAANSAALVTNTSVGQHRLSLSWTYPPLGQRTVTLDSDVNTCVFTATPSLTPSLTASPVPGTPSPTVTNTVPPQAEIEVTVTPSLTATRLPTLGPPVITSTPILIPSTGADFSPAGSLALIGRILTNLGLLFLGAALLIAGALLRAR